MSLLHLYRSELYVSLLTHGFFPFYWMVPNGTSACPNIPCLFFFFFFFLKRISLHNVCLPAMTLTHLGLTSPETLQELSISMMSPCSLLTCLPTQSEAVVARFLANPSFARASEDFYVFSLLFSPQHSTRLSLKHVLPLCIWFSSQLTSYCFPGLICWALLLCWPPIERCPRALSSASLRSTFMALLSLILECHLYSDDTQIYISSPDLGLDSTAYRTSSLECLIGISIQHGRSKWYISFPKF